MKRTLPPKGVKAPQGTTIFVEAEKPVEFRSDASLAASVNRTRGLPVELARLAYQTAQRLLQNPDLEARSLGQIGSAMASLAKVDIETGRYQLGEPGASINVNDNRQVNGTPSPTEVMAAYAATVRKQVEAAYAPPPIDVVQAEAAVEDVKLATVYEQLKSVEGENGNGHS